jgi:ELWxxDGT repeat protein
MVKDINPGAASSSIGYLTNVNGMLFFVANDGINGTELWKSDGTEGGTMMVKDIRPGSMGSNPSDLVNMNGIVFFAANDGVKGAELWQSDGTIAGTVMLKDINPNSGSSYPTSLAAVNSNIFFAADNGVNGSELWKSDGTAAGTVMVKDIWTGITGSYPTNLVNVSGTLFFAASNSSNGSELWKSDGTAAGTMMVKDVWPGSTGANPFCLRNISGTLFFSANNGTNGAELWKSDGTASGTVMVKDVWSGGQSGTIGNFSRFINELIFTGNDGINGNKTWESNGTASGTSIATGLVDPGSGTMQELVDNYDALYASITHPESGKELWGVNYAVILPVIWLDFKVRLENNDGILIWITDQEINTNEFIIEKSANGSNYTTVGSVAAANTSGKHIYTFIDRNLIFPVSGIIYYRLKQINKDGKYTYSAIISLPAGRNNVAIYPNPGNDQLNLVFNGYQAQAVKWMITDVTGKTMQQESRQISSGSNTFSIDIQRLAAGVYYLNLYGSYINKQMRFVKN